MRHPAIVAGLLLALVFTGCSSPSSTLTPSTTPAATQNATATPAVSTVAGTCTGALTPAETEGPYFKAGSPEETSLVGSGLPGTPLTLTGTVLDPSCQPIAGATLDFWQADDAGNYDNAGYTLRGHLETDASGAFTLTTIVPGLYPGRTRHIHVKVQAPGGPLLTTQLYVPDEPTNATDGLFDARLLMNATPAGSGLAASFTFVVATR
jgi:protocatechuate 3,4-dioxygenase beta subunit